MELPLTDLIITQPGNQLHEKFKQLRARDAEDIITARVILLSSWQPDYRINMQTTPVRLASISAKETNETCLEMIRCDAQGLSKQCQQRWQRLGAAWAIKYGPNCDLCGPCAIWVNIETFWEGMSTEGGQGGVRLGRALTHQSQKIKDCAADWSWAQLRVVVCFQVWEAAVEEGGWGGGELAVCPSWALQLFSPDK